MSNNYSEALNIQSNYFDLMENVFGRYYQEMRQSGSTPAKYAAACAADPHITDRALQELDTTLDEIRSFWSLQYAATTTSLSSSPLLTSVFGGNFFPTEDGSAVRSAGIYVDTIVLPEPLLRVDRIRGAVRPELLSAQVISNGIKALMYRDVIFLDKKTPLALIIPDPNSISPECEGIVSSLTQESVRLIASMVFQQDFADADSVAQFFTNIQSVEEFISLVQQPDLLALRDDVSLSLEEQIAASTTGYSIGLNDPASFVSIGHLIYSVFSGRIAQISELLVKAELLGASPLVETDGAWRQLVTQYGQKEQNGTLTDAAIAKALQSREQPGLNLLAPTTLDDLKGYRVAEDLEEVRSKIREGMNDVAAISANLLPDTIEKVASNLFTVFEEHSQKVRGLKQERRQYYGRDVWKCVVPATVAIVGNYYGYVPVEMLGALAGFLGLPAVPQLKRREKEIIERGKQLNRSAAGMLFRHAPS